MQPTSSPRKYIIPALIVIIILVGAGIFYHYRNNSASTVSTAPANWPTYTQKQFGIQLKHPSDWEVVDNLTSKTCCLFVVKYDVSTSTTETATGTPKTTVTAKERIKLQIGPYDVAIYDPFKSASTTKIRLGKNDLYTGVSNGILFYILPQSPTNGLGIAVFSYPETPDEAKETARQVISTIQLVTPTGTSTATTTVK